jgi:hypothetical protein
MALKYTKWQKNRPNGTKIPLQDTPKNTQIWIFG